MHMMSHALKGSTGAATAEEIIARFNSYIESLMQGKDPSKVRFVIEKDET